MAIKVASKTKLDNGISIEFADKGKTVGAFNLKELSADMVKQLAIHGLSQKLGDSYASLGGDIPAAINAVQGVWENLKKGLFVSRSASGGGLFVEAISRIKKVSIEQAGEMIAKLDEDNIETLKANPQVKAMMTVIRGERAATRAQGEDDLDLE